VFREIITTSTVQREVLSRERRSDIYKLGDNGTGDTQAQELSVPLNRRYSAYYHPNGNGQRLEVLGPNEGVEIVRLTSLVVRLMCDVRRPCVRSG
jgi:hypothetical protein